MLSRFRLMLTTSFTVSIFMVGIPCAVIADKDHQVRNLRESGDILSLEQIAERARNAKAGQILEIELESKRGRAVYEVELRDEAGQVWELKLDAKTGDLIKMKIDD